MTKGLAVAVACAAMMGLGTASLGAQLRPTTARPVTEAEPPPFSTRAYDRLFSGNPELPAPPRPPGPPLGRIAPRPTIAPERTCFLIVLRPERQLDPNFERPPADAGVRYGMRTGPAVCR